MQIPTETARDPRKVASWNERAIAIRALASTARNIGLLVVIVSAATMQLLWWTHEAGDLSTATALRIIITMSAASAVALYLPRQLGLPFWPTMFLLSGLTICGFVFLGSSREPVIFALAIVSSLPAFAVTQAAIYQISKPISLSRNRDETNG